MQSATRTVDHLEIKDWIESRAGRPAVVSSSRHGESAILRVDFGDDSDGVEEVSWEEFFRIFDQSDLAFLYEEEDDLGEESYFCKFVARNENEENDAYLDAGEIVEDSTDFTQEY